MTEHSMYKSTLAIAFSAAVTGLAGCASPAELVGTAAGAAVGSAVGGGTVATVAGGVVGYAAGKKYDEKRQR
jgi:phage-related minor tail protein